MTYDEAKDEVFRIVAAIERRAFFHMLLFRSLVIGVTLIFMAAGFAAISNQSAHDQADWDAHRENMRRSLEYMDHIMCAISAIKAAKTEEEKQVIYHQASVYTIEFANEQRRNRELGGH